MFKALTIARLAATLTQAARVKTASTATATTGTTATTGDDAWWAPNCDIHWSCGCMDENSDVYQLCRLLEDQFSNWKKERYEI